MMITPDQQNKLETGLQEIVALLLEQVQQDAGGCFWNTIHHEPLSGTFSYRINSSIWNGTAGISYFFLALYEHTADPSFLELAERSASRLLQEAAVREPRYYNLYDGVTGTIYLFLKLFEQTAKPGHLATAKALALQHGPAILTVTVEDLLDGIAGNLFVLTLLYHHTREEPILRYVHELILQLVSGARPGSRGLKWGHSELSTDALCGFSHGAAGIAHVLLQVGTYFSNPELIWLAEQAMVYEDTYYDAGINNWMDLRWTSAHLRLSRLFEWEKETFMPVNFDINAWAHGAAGIGISRLHAFRLTGNRDHLPAIEAVRKRCRFDCRHQTKRSHLLFSGYGGLAEFFLLYGQVTGNTEAVFEEAVAIGLAAVEQGRTHAHQGWGTSGHEDQGLMTGTAGIGFLLLRLLSKGSLDSILHSCLPAKAAEPAPGGLVSRLPVRRLIYQRYFSETLAALADKVPDTAACFSVGDLAACAAWLRNCIRSLPDAVGARLYDQWVVEATALELWRLHKGKLCFYTRLNHLKAQLPRYDEAADRFSSRKFLICPFVRILRVQTGWQLLYATEDRIHRLTIGHFPGLVLYHLQTAHSIQQLAARLAAAHQLPEAVLAGQLGQQCKALLQQFLIYEPGI